MSNQKVALITGGTDGMGKATAKKLLSEGWQVVIIGRNPSKCDAAVTDLKNAAQNNEISAIVADLSLLSETRKACDSFLAQHQTLDFLFLNANAISQKRILTSEGFESNFALGFLSRALMSKKLEDVLKATPGSQILTVVGLNTSKLDYDDLTMSRNYSSGRALGRWQWATQVFSKKFNETSPVLMNIYMPGLVRTKILSNEPGPMRLMVKLMNLVIGISVEKSAENVFTVITDIAQNKRKDAYYQWKELKPSPVLGVTSSDKQILWDLTEKLIKPYT